MATPLVVRTPAKLNLGLEVLGRRPDGYHDILTVMQTIDIYDELHFEAGGAGFEYVSDPTIAPGEDIARPILEARASELRWSGRLASEKHIPLAAGMGGGSSNAALAIRIAYAGERPDQLERRAAAIGADVPFLIRGGIALASGIGTTLHQLPAQPIWFVIAIPQVAIEHKTGTMYSRLTSDDFTSGEAVSQIARALKSGQPFPDRLPNAFERVMRSHRTVEEAWRVIESVAGRAALSGAGPAVFAWFDNRDDASSAVKQIRKSLPTPVLLAKHVTRYDDDPAVAQVAQALRPGPAPLSEQGG